MKAFVIILSVWLVFATSSVSGQPVEEVNTPVSEVNQPVGIFSGIGGWLDQNSIQWIDDHLNRTGIAVDLHNEGEIIETVGATIINDLFIERLDLAIDYDLDKSILFGLDYVARHCKEYDLYVGCFIRDDRWEKLNDWGQIGYGFRGGIKF